MDKLLEIISEIDIPSAYDHFAEGESPDPPFICYLIPGNDNFAADGKAYFKVDQVNIELYTDLKDPETEKEGQEAKKPDAAKIIAGILAFVICCAFGSSDSFAFWEEDLTFEGESVYNYLQVREDAGSVYLSTNVLFGVQSVYMKNGGLTGMYYDYAMAAPIMAGINTGSFTEAEPFRILILGNGSGTFATQCQRYFSEGLFAVPLVIDAVEIDQDITDPAEKYFDLPDKVNVYTYDGRAFLNVCKDKYDVIMVDAYQDITIPFQMSSLEFFTLVKEHLADDGVMVVNLNMRGGENAMNTHIADTIGACFEQVWTVDVDYTTNRELFASDSPEMTDTFRKGCEGYCISSFSTDRDLYLFMQRAEKGLKQYTPGSMIMTDDQAPVELLSMKAIDGIIYDEVAYFKDIYKEQGMKGVIDALK